MRELARRVALTYLEQRKELEYPLLKETQPQPRNAHPRQSKIELAAPASFILEIGVEELPAHDVESALNQLRERVPLWLNNLRLEHGPVRIHATPRRLAVFVENLAPAQPDREELVKGPPAERAFDKDGIATPAALGFAKKNGVEIKDLQTREIDNGKYVVAIIRSKGRPTPEVLAEALPDFIAKISFIKTMRWNASGVAFSRPIRWLVALLGDQIIPFEYAGVSSGNLSRGLRPYDSPILPISSAEKYFDLLRAAGIVLDGEERKALIVEQVKAAAQKAGGEAIIEPGLLAEVTNLVEKPTAVLGGFNAEFLQLPTDVLIGTMKKHQRYFPIQKAAGAPVSDVKSNPVSNAANPETALLPFFIAIRNGDAEYLDLVRQGNEHVLGARFADANFFVQEDLKKPLKAYRAELQKLTFQTRLGSMLDKSERILALTESLCEATATEGFDFAHAMRAAFLMKADLATQMVTEMTSLQGIIGGEYARHDGEAEEVAQAIAEQYQPVPRTRPGLLIALADRIDSLVGLFAVGLAPTGAKDPFGLRRAAIGTVQPLIEHDLDFDLRAIVEKSAAGQPLPVSDEVKAQVLEFIAGRLKVVLNDAGYRYDVVEAVLAAQSNNPAGCARAVKQLEQWVKRPDWTPILDGYARCVRIIRSASVSNNQWSVTGEKLLEPAEKALYEALQTANRRPSTVDDFLATVETLIPVINTFFDKVLVMDENESMRQNRLALVGQIANLSDGIADLSKLEGF